MATWSSRRKLVYGGSFAIAIALILGALFFSFFYTPPTCSDRVMNGNETGVDCGGSCRKLCQSAFIPAKIAWGGGKSEKVAPGFYNVASYIINPNLNAAAANVPYKFALFDNKGILITERQGKINIPAGRNTLAFDAGVSVGARIPTKVTFEFLSQPIWFKSKDALGGISIVEKKYTEDDQSSSLEITLENKSLIPYKNVTVAAVLFDTDENAIGFSRTQIDLLNPSGGRDIAPFTWPFSRGGRVVSVEALPVITPVRE